MAKTEELKKIVREIAAEALADGKLEPHELVSVGAKVGVLVSQRVKDLDADGVKVVADEMLAVCRENSVSIVKGAVKSLSLARAPEPIRRLLSCCIDTVVADEPVTVVKKIVEDVEKKVVDVVEDSVGDVVKAALEVRSLSDVAAVVEVVKNESKEVAEKVEKIVDSVLEKQPIDQELSAPVPAKKEEKLSTSLPSVKESQEEPEESP
jgi:hypothetical protein